MLTLKITDNGKGFNPQVLTNGNGLKSMHARAAELHGELEIAQRAEGGAVVTLTVKIPQTRYGNNFRKAIS
jgi:signal transduction histidine kinase